MTDGEQSTLEDIQRGGFNAYLLKIRKRSEEETVCECGDSENNAEHVLFRFESEKPLQEAADRRLGGRVQMSTRYELRRVDE